MSEAETTTSLPEPWCIRGEFNIYTAQESKALLQQALQAGALVALDLSAVTEMDSAGVQLLLLAQREARCAGQTFQVVRASDAVRELLQFMGLAETLLSEVAA